MQKLLFGGSGHRYWKWKAASSTPENTCRCRVINMKLCLEEDLLNIFGLVSTYAVSKQTFPFTDSDGAQLCEGKLRVEPSRHRK